MKLATEAQRLQEALEGIWDLINQVGGVVKLKAQTEAELNDKCEIGEDAWWRAESKYEMIKRKKMKSLPEHNVGGGEVIEGESDGGEEEVETSW